MTYQFKKNEETNKAITCIRRVIARAARKKEGLEIYRASIVEDGNKLKIQFTNDQVCHVWVKIKIAPNKENVSRHYAIWSDYGDHKENLMGSYKVDLNGFLAMFKHTGLSLDEVAMEKLYEGMFFEALEK